MGSVLMACGAAAAMSTANAQVLAISTVYTMDIHRKYINKNMTEHQLIWVGRWALLILSAVAYIMCLYVPGLLVTIGLVALGGTAQVMIPTCGALFWKRSTVAGAMSGLIVRAGSVGGLYLYSGQSSGTLCFRRRRIAGINLQPDRICGRVLLVQTETGKTDEPVKAAVRRFLSSGKYVRISDISQYPKTVPQIILRRCFSIMTVYIT